MTRAIKKIRERIRRRKHLREAHRRKHQKQRTLREMRAIQHLRAVLDHLNSEPHVMFDDTSVGLIPKAARAVAGYVNGSFLTFPSLRALFPKARRVSIAVNSTVDAHFLDIEPGDATNADAPGWFDRHDHQKYGKAGFYTSASNVAALIQTLADHGIARNEYIIWSAHYNERRHICSPDVCGFPAAQATQWTSTANHKSLDESKVSHGFWARLKHN